MKLPSIARWASVAFLTATTANTLIAAQPISWTINGYIQPRFTLVNGSSTSGITNSTFDVRRYTLSVRAQINPHISAVVSPNGFPSPSLLEAYGEYADTRYSARLGLSRIPFGYEAPLSSNRLITLERSQVVTALFVTPGLWYDRGLFAYAQPVKGLSLAAGIVNGASTSTSQDPNNGKNIVARVGYQFPAKVAVGASIYTGTVAASHDDVQRAGVDVNASLGDLKLVSEGLVGKDGDKESRGAYVTVTYAKWRTQPYARYDVYDPDTDTANDQFKRLTVGIGHYVNPNTKLSLEYEAVDDDLQPSLNGRLSTQYQISF